MNSSLRAKAEKRLPNVPHEILMTSLLNLAEHSPEASQLVEELITTSDEALASFKRKISGLKRRKHFYRLSEMGSLAAEVEGLLRLLDHDTLPPCEVLSVLVSFFQSDSAIMEMGDDSHGELGHVFAQSATKRFVRVASLIDDQKFLKTAFKNVYKENGYGVRDKVVDHAAEFLTEESLRELYDHYASVTSDDYDGRQARILAEHLSAQLRDPELFEAETRKVSEQYFHAKLPELAEVYLAADRAEELTEHLDDWFSLVPTHHRRNLEEIAQKVYANVNDQGKLEKLLTKQFLSEASQKAYQSLSRILSPEKHSALLDRFQDLALNSPSLNLSQIGFLLNSGKSETAASLVSKHSDELDGDLYYSLPDLAKAFIEAEEALAATLIFRALLGSILKRGTTKAYGHAVRYLQTLHTLSPSIDDWHSHQNHLGFLQDLHQHHYRKSSFWKRVPDEIRSAAENS